MRKQLSTVGLIFGLVVISAGVLHAQDTSPIQGEGSNWQVTGDALDSAYHHQEGEVSLGFGADVTAVAGIADGAVSTPENFILGLTGGLGYFPLELLSTNLDLATNLVFGGDAGFDLSQLMITPGARIFPIPEAFLRVGVPVNVIDDVTVFALGGLGYEVPVSDTQFVTGEVGFQYPINGEGGGLITVGGGTSFAF